MSKNSIHQFIFLYNIFQYTYRCFDKLTHVSLNHQCITDAGIPGEIQNCCPNILDLDLCNNCITDWDTVSEICQQLKHLTCLNLR